MADLRTNKVDAARRQLEAAIRMFFGGEDPFAIHTVASAAYRILRDLAVGSGKSPFHEDVKRFIRPGKENQFWWSINKAANFLKHADEDTDAVLEVKEEFNDFTIGLGCMYYHSLGYKLTPDMRGFMGWLMLMNPDILIDSPEKEVLAGKEFDNLRSRPRSEQIALGRVFWLMVRKQTVST